MSTSWPLATLGGRWPTSCGRVAPQVAGELAGHQLEEDVGLAVEGSDRRHGGQHPPRLWRRPGRLPAYWAEHQVPELLAATAVIAAYLAVRTHREPRLSVASLARRLAAIRKVHDLNGYRGQANPGRHPGVHRAWAGTRRQRTWTQQQAQGRR